MTTMRLFAILICMPLLLAACRTSLGYKKGHNAMLISSFALSSLDLPISLSYPITIRTRKCPKKEVPETYHLSSDIFRMEIYSSGKDETIIGICYISCDADGLPKYSIWERNETKEMHCTNQTNIIDLSYCALALALFSNMSPATPSLNVEVSIEHNAGKCIYIQDLDKISFDRPTLVFKDGTSYFDAGE